MSMSNSETPTHQFTDRLLRNADKNGDGLVFVDLGNDGDYLLFSKEDLLYMLTLCEETN